MPRRNAPHRAIHSLAALLGLATVAFAAGCGGGSAGQQTASGAARFEVRADTTMHTTPRLTKAAFVGQVNEICRHAWPMIRSDYRVYSRTQEAGLSNRQRTADAIRMTLMASIDLHIFDYIYRLGAPPGQKAATERIIGAMQEAVERGQRLGPLFSIPEVATLYGAFNRRAAAYGLEACIVDKAHLRLPIAGA